MAQTEKGIVYPDDYSKVADVPADMQAMAESIDDMIGSMEENINGELEDKVEKEEGKGLSTNDFNDTYKEKLEELENYDDTELSNRITTNENSIEALQQENQRLKQTLPTTTGTGETITLNKTAELDFVIPPLPEGNTKQNTTEGIQRIDTNETINETTSNGVTYSLKNGVFKFNGTATAAFYVVLTNKVNLESGTYTFAPADESGSYTGTMGKYGYKNTNILEGGQTKAVTNSSLNEDYNDVVLRFFIADGCVFNNYQFKINLVKGTYTSSTIPAWEPYTNGASPNPSYEQEVQVVKGDVEVLVQNKNLLDISKLSMMASNTRLTTGENHIPVLPNTTYVFSVKNATGIDGNIALYDENDNNTSNYAQGSVHPSTCTFTTGANDSYLKIARWYIGTTFTSIEAIEPQLEINSVKTDYVPYTAQTLPLTLGDIELCKIGDYKDYPFKNLTNGKWYWHKENGKAVLDGSENWFYYQDHLILNQNASAINMVPSTNQVLCNYYPYNSQGQDKSFKTGASYSIQVYDNSYSDSSTFKNWLSTHNMQVYYALATPTDTEITDTTLISQLEAINNAISYYEQTNISGTSGGISPLFDVEAYQSTKLLLEDIINSN